MGKEMYRDDFGICGEACTTYVSVPAFNGVRVADTPSSKLSPSPSPSSISALNALIRSNISTSGVTSSPGGASLATPVLRTSTSSSVTSDTVSPPSSLTLTNVVVGSDTTGVAVDRAVTASSVPRLRIEIRSVSGCVMRWGSTSTGCEWVGGIASSRDT
ncbi:hypothetical protein BC829DRAFT_408390 [Chytridium lagenaria]|nr:hypothetical protein BC829DRAFT_408390 [Chytridium lagenaria]